MTILITGMGDESAESVEISYYSLSVEFRLINVIKTLS